jgi:hypothetical protein
MARHWSVYCGGVTERQGMALDRIARERGIGDGMDLLMDLTGYSRSKVGKMDRASLRPYLDEAFALADAPPEEPPGRSEAVAVAAQTVGLSPGTPAGIVADRVAELVDERSAAIVRIRGLMAEYGITAAELAAGGA